MKSYCLERRNKEGKKRIAPKLKVESQRPIKTNKLYTHKFILDMKNLKNTVQLIGNLGMNPEVKTLESGSTVVNFSIATSDRYKNKEGEQVENTTWHNLVAWGKTAEIAEKYLKKGAQVAVEGKLTNRSYEAKDGTKKYVSEILVNEILLLGAKE
jgi:single-strand DNA-binding protein